MSAAKRLAADIGARWPLPKAERESLAAIVLKVAERALVPLASAGREPTVRIADDGRFEASFVLDPAFAGPVSAADPAARSMIRVVSETVAFSKEWIAGPRETLVYRSAVAHPFLVRPEAPAANDLSRLGLTDLPKCPVLKSLCAAFIEAGKLASKSDAAKRRSTIAALTHTVPVGTQDPNGRKFKGLVDDRGWDQKLGDTGLDGMWAEIDRAVGSGLELVAAGSKKLVDGEPAALAAFGKYFGSTEAKLVRRALAVLEHVQAFLSSATRSIFHSTEFVDLDDRFLTDAQREVKVAFKASHDTIALHHRGHIFLDTFGMTLKSASLDHAILHEAIHANLHNSHRREGKADPGYLWEGNLESLTSEQALDNPDSYIAFLQAL
ncbi:hypothetical protein [Gimibacter soli]|uniref:Uncharacterized protein n=1 Tax=Gimibacter soli TaxID=3024400 RepID=A0AAE9XTR3_9PROT|nr:hypothetical protein [Gimibacter soli]WCL54696.1 hypothetical protein PH603_02840 [Gimibacter soli]